VVQTNAVDMKVFQTLAQRANTELLALKEAAITAKRTGTTPETSAESESPSCSL